MHHYPLRLTLSAGALWEPTGQKILSSAVRKMKIASGQVGDKYLVTLIDVLCCKDLDGCVFIRPVLYNSIGVTAVIQKGVEHVDSLDGDTLPFFFPTVVPNP